MLTNMACTIIRLRGEWDYTTASVLKMLRTEPQGYAKESSGLRELFV